MNADFKSGTVGVNVLCGGLGLEIRGPVEGRGYSAMGAIILNPSGGFPNDRGGAAGGDGSRCR